MKDGVYNMSRQKTRWKDTGCYTAPGCILSLSLRTVVTSFVISKAIVAEMMKLSQNSATAGKGLAAAGKS